MTLQEQKTQYLKYLGFEAEHITPESVSFETKEYLAEIKFDDFEIGESYEQIFDKAQIFSCCGDILDRDYMICPSCKEHC